MSPGFRCSCLFRLRMGMGSRREAAPGGVQASPVPCPEPSTSMPGNGGIRIASPFTQSFLAPYIRRVEGVDLCRFV